MADLAAAGRVTQLTGHHDHATRWTELTAVDDHMLRRACREIDRARRGLGYPAALTRFLLTSVGKLPALLRDEVLDALTGLPVTFMSPICRVFSSTPRESVWPVELGRPSYGSPCSMSTTAFGIFKNDEVGIVAVAVPVFDPLCPKPDEPLDLGGLIECAEVEVVARMTVEDTTLVPPSSTVWLSKAASDIRGVELGDTTANVRAAMLEPCARPCMPPGLITAPKSRLQPPKCPIPPLTTQRRRHWHDQRWLTVGVTTPTV